MERKKKRVNVKLGGWVYGEYQKADDKHGHYLVLGEKQGGDWEERREESKNLQNSTERCNIIINIIIYSN